MLITNDLMFVFYVVRVYGSTEQSFFTKLKENGIDTFKQIIPY